MLTKFSLLVFILRYSVVLSARCSLKNPKPGELNPFVKLEVITKQSYPQNHHFHVTLRCTARAPVALPLYNPSLLEPNVIQFFLNEKRVAVNNCPPSSGSNQKTCELVIPRFRPKNAGKYHCVARNGYRCTAIEARIPVNTCPLPGVKEKEALDLYENKLMKRIKCLKDFTLCCITGSNCNQDYQNCLQLA